MSAFKSPLVMRDENDQGRHFVLTDNLIYQSDKLGPITVPAGFQTDLASIPRGLWNILPPIGGYDKAAVVHDYLYAKAPVLVVDGDFMLPRQISRGDADSALKEAMEVLGVGRFTRWAIYL